MKKLRILMVIERFFPLTGGSETQCYQLSQKFVSCGALVLVATKRWRKEFAPFETSKEGFDIFRLGIPGNNRIADYFNGLALLFFLFLKRNSFDLIYINGGLANIFGSTAILGGKLLGKPVGGKVATPGELTFSGPKALSPKKFVHPLIKIRLWLAKKADFYTAHTSEVVEELLEKGIKKEKIKEFTNSVDEKLFKPVGLKEKIRLRKQLSLPQNKVIVVFCGRLVKRKGLIYLLKGWEQFGHLTKKALLLIIGSGENQPDSVEEELKNYVKKQRLSNIWFLGNKKREEVVKLLKTGDIFVYPSIHPEGTALSILEAMSCGLPVVGTEIGGIKKLVIDNKNGFLVEKKNPNKLIKKVLFLIDKRNTRIKFGKEGRKLVLKEYTNDKVAKMYFNYFKDLI